MNSASRTKLWVGLTILAVAIVAFVWTQSQTPDATPPPPSDGTPDTAETSSDLPTRQVDPGRFYDYQFAESPLANAVRDLISTPLILPYQTETVNVLLRNIEWEGETATLLLRAGIYWSDGEPLSARHVVDAFSRFVTLSGSPTFKKSKDVDKWRTFTMHSEGAERVVIANYSSKEDLIKLLASHYMRPYRADLGKGDQDLNDAFLVSIGPYRMQSVTNETLTLPGSLQLLPNDVYYKGPKQTSLEIDLVPLFPEE